MKKKASPMIFAATYFLLSLTPFSTVTGGQTLDAFHWGQPTEGVQMSLSSNDSNGSDLIVALRNVGDHDVTLDLGYMMANDKVQVPKLEVAGSSPVTRSIFLNKLGNPRKWCWYLR